MATETENLTLKNLEYLPYLDDQGLLCEDFQGQIGVYAIFDQEKVLQFVGYSRDIYLSFKQHLIRQPHHCYWLKIQTIPRPSRTTLEEIKQAWIEENKDIPVGNGENLELWTQPIDAKLSMTEEEKETYQKIDELSQIKLLKKIARRVESDLQETLEKRGSQVEIRFNPKLKEQGLLDLK